VIETSFKETSVKSIILTVLFHPGKCHFSISVSSSQPSFSNSQTMNTVLRLLFAIIVATAQLLHSKASTDERYTVRNRRIRARNSAAHNGKVRRGNANANKFKDDDMNAENKPFSEEQLDTYRRLGITCGGGYVGQEGGDYVEESGNEGDFYFEEGSKEGDYYGEEDGQRWRRRRRRTAMRAFPFHRAGECICDEELGVCWIWGDQYDDPICCHPDGDKKSPEYAPFAPIQAPIHSPVSPLASLSPPAGEEWTWSNDVPTFMPAAY
jgi:hypothetical protein